MDVKCRKPIFFQKIKIWYTKIGLKVKYTSNGEKREAIFLYRDFDTSFERWDWVNATQVTWDNLGSLFKSQEM